VGHKQTSVWWCAGGGEGQGSKTHTGNKKLKTKIKNGRGGGKKGTNKKKKWWEVKNFCSPGGQKTKKKKKKIKHGKCQTQYLVNGSTQKRKKKKIQNKKKFQG